MVAPSSQRQLHALRHEESSEADDCSSVGPEDVVAAQASVLTSVHIRQCRGSAEYNLDKSSRTFDGLAALQVSACSYAHEQYLEDFADSAIEDWSHNLPSFTYSEIIKGRLLGTGGFGMVSQCNGFSIPEISVRRRASVAALQRWKSWKRPNSDHGGGGTPLDTSHRGSNGDDSGSEVLDATTEPENTLQRDEALGSHRTPIDQTDARKFIATHCRRPHSGDARYAIKQLKDELIADPDSLFQGILDLNLETRILSSLPHHPNVIKLRAISSGDRFDPYYFIILDRLYDTLETKLQKWRDLLSGRIVPRQSLFQSCFKPCWSSNRRDRQEAEAILESSRHDNVSPQELKDLKRRHQQTVDRLWAAFDLASAVAHLHKHHIMHRDLKPDNIGFDVRDDIKIFDLGLAKEIPQDGTEGPWKLTAMCGSPRYMAPEVATDKQYDAKCDCYSFALLFWEIMNLKKPFGRVTMDKLQRLVWNDSYQRRPKIQVVANSTSNYAFVDEQLTLFLTSPKAAWTKELKELVESAWHHYPSRRPTMEHVEQELKKHLKKGIEVMDSVHGGLDKLLESKRLSHNARRSTFVYHPPAANNNVGDSVGGRGNEAPHRSTSQEAQANVLAWWGSSTRLFSGRHLSNKQSSKTQDTNRQRRSQLFATDAMGGGSGGFKPALANVSEDC